ncbi:hypothetical protein DFJ73DRAFT_798410 [Zopfochytrium polystomum]|nr:hypothetical protein DFJ73DRAFT_798410 [Zopfochytrium polystomum]
MSPITPLGTPAVSAFTTTVPGLGSTTRSTTSRTPTVTTGAKRHPSPFARFAYKKFDTEASSSSPSSSPSSAKSPTSRVSKSSAADASTDAKLAQPVKVKRAPIIMYGSYRMGLRSPDETASDPLLTSSNQRHRTAVGAPTAPKPALKKPPVVDFAAFQSSRI